MAPEDPTGARPGPVVLRIKLRFDDVEAMTQRFAPNVGRSGLFLPTRSMQPVGAEVKFELRLANDQAVLVGLGRVQLAKEPDPENPRATFGLGVELMRVTRESRELILKLLARRRQLGLPDVALPGPAEIDAARGVVEGAAVPAAAVPAAAVPAAAVPAVPTPAAVGAELLTAPRRTTGPLAAVKSTVIEPLAAEPQRKKRTPMSELIASASGPIAAPVVPGLEDEIDVGKALARARALTTGDLDRELEDLREVVSAPLAEVSIEAASAELARQLGGSAVRKDRSQGWAPPPASVATEEAKEEPEPAKEPEPAPVEEAKAAPPVEAAPVEAAPVEEAPVEAAPVEESKPEPVEAAPVEEAPVEEAPVEEAKADPVTAPVPEEAPPESAEATADAPLDEGVDEGVIERDEADLAHLRESQAPDEQQRRFAPAGADEIVTEPRHGRVERWAPEGAVGVRTQPAVVPAEVHEVDDAQIAEMLSDSFEEESEHTHIGAEPGDEPDDDDDDDDSFGFDAPSPSAVHRDRALSSGGEYDSAVVEEPGADADEPDPAESATIALPADSATLDALLGGLAPDASVDHAGHAGDHGDLDEEEAEEIEDFEILDVADADDADLLGAQADVPIPRAPSPALASHQRPSFDDFAGRLDLGDDSDSFSRVDAPPAFDDGASFDSVTSSGVPTPAYGRTEDASTDFEDRHAGFSPPHAFDQSDVIEIPPELRRDQKVSRARVVPLAARAPARSVLRDADDDDLAAALDALDGDLDELAPPPTAAPAAKKSMPVPRTMIGNPGSGRVVAPTAHTPSGRTPRPSVDDGILIDFDDDEND